MTRFLILAATFVSAFLLFTIQPLYAKYLLPFFGGTSSVWTISVFFYSVSLLLGYVYASLIVSWSAKTARWVHTILLSLAVVLLLTRWYTTDSPLLVEAVGNYVPAISVLLTLLLGVGLPVVLLASTSVLMQNLYARLTQEEPYALFALSNAGSLLGLAAYPFIFEPFSTLSLQAMWWVSGFVCLVGLLVLAWTLVDKVQPAVAVVQKAKAVVLQHRLQIVMMAAVPTFLLAASTEYLSKGIASFPLLWIIPLMLYLISFIVSFSGRASLNAKVPIGFWVVISLVPVIALMPVMNVHAVIYWIGFFFVCACVFLISTYFHARVYALRPAVTDLGPFYVYVTLGGAIGSGMVGLVLPFVLSDQVELPIAFAFLTMYFAYRYLLWLKEKISLFFVRVSQGMLVVLVSMFVFTQVFGIEYVSTQRNFYGVLKVVDQTRQVDEVSINTRMIVNGFTNHGLQALDDRYESTAASYYGPNSGIDVAVRSFVDRGESPRVSVVGLGAGMMNAYCDWAQTISYVEINPMVETIAREYFTYLEMCSEKTTVEIGDGRLVLDEKVANGWTQYDVIMMDAFTDDAIPTHLLTTEAFSQTYQPLLSEKGIIAFHISNKYLNLFAPIVGMARDNQYEVVAVRNVPDEADELQYPTVWVLVARPQTVEDLQRNYSNTKRYTGEELVWSDEKNSVLQVLSVNGSEW